MRRPTLILAVAIAFGSFVNLVSSNYGLPNSPGFWIICLAVSLFLAVWLATGGKHASDNLCSILVFVLIPLAFIAIWNNQDAFVQSGLRFDVFAGYKIVALFIALIALPKKWLGYLILGVTGLLPTIQYYFHWDAPMRKVASIQEPYLVWIIVALSALVYFHRLDYIETDRKLVTASADAASARRFAHLMLHARDLANSPLQTITNAVAVLHARNPKDESTLEKIKNAVDRLKKVTALLSEYESHVNWKDYDKQQVAEFDWSFEMRNLCFECLKPEATCYCVEVRPFQSKAQIVLLQHPLERKRTIGTARMIHLSIENSILIGGSEFGDHPRVNALISDPENYCVVLYPGANATNISENEIDTGNKKLVIFVIDGTWHCAKTMLNRSPNILKLPQIVFTPTNKSEYGFRQQPESHCLSSIEAVHQVLKILEPSQGANDLLELFRSMVSKQIKFSLGNKIRRCAKTEGPSEASQNHLV